MITVWGFTLVATMGCGVSQEEVDGLTAQVTAEQARSTELEARLTKVEDRMKGIGFRGVRHRWDARKWVNPDVRCKGAPDTPRDFSTSPAQICVNSGFLRYKRPDAMRIQARVPDGEVVFNERVPYDAEEKSYCFVIPGNSCESLHSLGLGVSPPALNTG